MPSTRSGASEAAEGEDELVGADVLEEAARQLAAEGAARKAAEGSVACLLYTSDAADDTHCVDQGCPRKVETTQRNSRRSEIPYNTMTWERLIDILNKIELTKLTH